VFDRRIAGGIVGHLASASTHFSRAQDQLPARQAGRAPVQAGIRIVDDPLRVRGLRSRPFDGEGVAAKPLAIIEDGVLKTWLLDCTTHANSTSRLPDTPSVAYRRRRRRGRPTCISNLAQGRRRSSSPTSPRASTSPS